jgi:hypothetical protein
MKMVAVVRKRNKPTRVMANLIGVLEKMREILQSRLPTVQSFANILLHNLPMERLSQMNR